MQVQVRRVSVFILSLTLAAAVACGNQAEPPASSTIRDSAGVQIIEASPGLGAVVLDVVDSVAIRIGVAEGAESYQLHQVWGVRTLPDHSILVLNAGSHELRRYDTTGTWLSSFGRRGGGPLEMRYPMGLTRFRADSSLLFDLTLRGFKVVDPTGRIVRVHSLQSSLSGFAGLLDDSTALVQEWRSTANVYDEIVSPSVTVATVSLESSQKDTVFTLEGPPQYNYTHGELVRTVSMPFTVIPSVVARNGEIYTANGSTPDVRVYDRHGVLIRIIRLPVVQRSVTAADWDAAVRVVLESKGAASGEGRLGPQEIERQRRILATLPRPEIMPFIDMMHLSDPATLWVRQHGVHKGQNTWFGIDKEGRITATATLPSRLLVRELTHDWALGIEVDASDVEYVVKYPLRSRE